MHSLWETHFSSLYKLRCFDVTFVERVSYLFSLLLALFLLRTWSFVLLLFYLYCQGLLDIFHGNIVWVWPSAAVFLGFGSWKLKALEHNNQSVCLLSPRVPLWSTSQPLLMMSSWCLIQSSWGRFDLNAFSGPKCLLGVILLYLISRCITFVKFFLHQTTTGL